ncbi:Radical SAM superfamily protein [Novipirellula aureliae]|uniref:Radical SAM superfamily protein n=1 Tax=Novipirellula aureliae TaxID=2527966 RepID=A0A5C6DK81_9BACT|nr:radical SAM protein [Novipirellula aureliae]TWU37743.1 Radical SAM superfamily protein [Novipirellula aureliae]
MNVYRADFKQPYREDPPPRRDLLKRNGYLTTTSLIATRGCHNRCGFCYLSTKGLHMPYLMRDVELIADEFRQDGQPYGVVTDNNLGSKPEYLRQLCHALRPLEKIWSAAISIDVTDDPSLVREMALPGCTGVFVGFESLQNGNIRDAKKKSPRTEQYAERVELLHRNGIQVNGSFVLGFDHDHEDVFGTTVKWIEENRLECATLAMSYFYKRSNPIWHRLIKHPMTARAWRPLVEFTPRRHVRFCRRLAKQSLDNSRSP